MGLGPRVVSTWPMGSHNGKTLIFWEIEVEHGKIHPWVVGLWFRLSGPVMGFGELVSDVGW